MRAINRNLSKVEFERDETPNAVTRYGDEIVRTSTDPDMAVAGQQMQPLPAVQPISNPSRMFPMDVCILE